MILIDYMPVSRLPLQYTGREGSSGTMVTDSRMGMLT